MIEELVSGATNAGLAKSHEKAKNERKGEIKFWRIIFILDMLLILWVLTEIPSLKNFEFSLSGIGQRFLLSFSIILPLIWLGMLANKNIHQNKRLYEEYLHKWAITFSFDGMKREIKELDPTEDRKYVKKLLNIYLEATELSPSLTLDKVQKTDSPADKLAEIIPMDKLTEIAKEVINIKEKLDNQK